MPRICCVELGVTVMSTSSPSAAKSPRARARRVAGSGVNTFRRSGTLGFCCGSPGVAMFLSFCLNPPGIQFCDKVWICVREPCPHDVSELNMFKFSGRKNFQSRLAYVPVAGKSKWFIIHLDLEMSGEVLIRLRAALGRVPLQSGGPGVFPFPPP